jgi:pimeloyl-ACP methyl ester carboxylesterase
MLNHTLMPLMAEALQKPINRKIFGPADTPEAWRRDFSWAMAVRPTRMRAGAADAIHMGPGARRIHGRYPDIKLPVSIVAGTRDRLVDTPTQAERLHAELPHSRLKLVDEVGHMVHHSAMRDVAAAIRAT